MSNQVKAYVPEFLLTDEKQENALRVCKEDCLVVDPSDRFRILVSRTRTPLSKDRWDQAYAIPPSEMRFLQDALTENKRVLLMGRDRRPLLVFAELLRSVGILFAVAPHADADGIARVLLHTGRTDIAITPSLRKTSTVPHTEDDAIYEQLDELFFYVDRIFSPAPQIGLRTRTHLIANFAGCVLDDVAVPLDSLACPPSEQDRLIAFLLCAFLALRRQDGGVSARTDTSNPPLLRYRVEPITDKTGAQVSETDFPFLSLSSFHRFAVLNTENGSPALEAYLHPADGRGRLCANAPTLIGLRFVAC